MVCTKSLLFAGILSLASSLAVDYVPVATAISNNGASFNLSPTPAPAPDELRRRQASQITVQTLLAAPDNTCGYFQGNSDAPWGCSTGNCVFATPTAAAVSNGTKGAGGVLCCDPKTGCPAAPAATACVGRDDYNKTCTGSCTSDPATLKCTSGIYLWCNTVTFTTPNISAFFCNYISTTDPLPAQTAFPGQAGHALTTTVAKFATTLAPSTSLPSSLKSPTGTHSASATVGASTGGAGKSNKGPVIGGAVGGVLGLALIAGAVIMFLRRRNRREPDQGQKGAASSTEEVSAPAAAKAEPVVTTRPK